MRHYFGDDEMLFFEPASTEDLARAIRDLLADPAAADGGPSGASSSWTSSSWSAQKETLVEAVETLAGPARSHSPRQQGIRGPARDIRPERSVNSRCQIEGQDDNDHVRFAEFAPTTPRRKPSPGWTTPGPRRPSRLPCWSSGLGEVGRPLLEILRGAHRAAGRDIDGPSLPRRADPSSLFPVRCRFRLDRPPRTSRGTSPRSSW